VGHPKDGRRLEGAVHIIFPFLLVFTLLFTLLVTFTLLLFLLCCGYYRERGAGEGVLSKPSHKAVMNNEDYI
jgi:hypothetical protein